jgi:iron(III) transport system permease protein
VITAHLYRQQDRWTLALLVLVISIVAAAPILRLIWEAIAPGGQVSAAAFERVTASPALWIALGNSLETALGATLLALIFGGAVALLVTLTNIRARNGFTFLFVMPLIIAPQVMALAWLQISGPSSALLALVGLAPPIGTKNPLYSREGIILLLAIEYSPLVFLTLRAGLRALPRELIEAGLASGASAFTIVRTIVLPLMTPAIGAGMALVFVSSLGNFGIPAFLGIPGQYLTLPTLIYQRLSGLGPGVLSDVAVMSSLIGVIALAGILAQEWLMRRRDYRIVTTSVRPRAFELGSCRLTVEFALWSITLMMVVIPLFGLLATALVPAFGVPLSWETASLQNFTYVISEHQASRRALWNSFWLSAAAAGLVIMLSIPLAYFIVWRPSALTRSLNVAVEMPYALPGVALAISCILLFLRPMPLIGISLYNTVWILLVAYLARFLVLGLRPVMSGLNQIDRGLEEAAQMAGSRFAKRLLTIILPVIAPVAAAGGILVFLTAFNELTLSALLWSSGAETLGVVVFSLEQGGESSAAAAISIVTIVVTVGLALSTLLFHHRLPQGVLPWRD